MQTSDFELRLVIIFKKVDFKNGLFYQQVNQRRLIVVPSMFLI